MREIIVKNNELFLELKYATTDNFVKEKLYDEARCFLHEEAYQKFYSALNFANNLGYKLKIFDAYRPIKIQQYLWDKYEDERFLSNPQTGSVPHCRGIAIDLTLTDTAGNELDMGTGFDEFNEKSFHGAQNITQKAQQNRLILLGIMTQAGFDFYKNEWWHYQLFTPHSYPIITDLAL